jgi:hypothetical protein
MTMTDNANWRTLIAEGRRSLSSLPMRTPGADAECVTVGLPGVRCLDNLNEPLGLKELNREFRQDAAKEHTVGFSFYQGEKRHCGW